MDGPAGGHLLAFGDLIFDDVVERQRGSEQTQELFETLAVYGLRARRWIEGIVGGEERVYKRQVPLVNCLRIEPPNEGFVGLTGHDCSPWSALRQHVDDLASKEVTMGAGPA